MAAWPTHEEWVGDRYIPKPRANQCKYRNFSWQKNDPVFLQIYFYQWSSALVTSRLEVLGSILASSTSYSTSGRWVAAQVWTNLLSRIILGNSVY